MHTRIGVFTDSIGELEPILRRSVAELRKTMFDFTLTAGARDRRLDEMMAAIEEQRHALAEVENAAAFLASTDQAEIDGLEEDLLTSGRYIGQPELVHLLKDWAAYAPGAHCKVDTSGTHLSFRGTAAMEIHLRGVQSAGERSRSEIDHLAKAMLDERELILCLDQSTRREDRAPALDCESSDGASRVARPWERPISIRPGSVGDRIRHAGSVPRSRGDRTVDWAASVSRVLDVSSRAELRPCHRRRGRVDTACSTRRIADSARAGHRGGAWHCAPRGRTLTAETPRGRSRQAIRHEQGAGGNKAYQPSRNPRTKGRPDRAAHHNSERTREYWVVHLQEAQRANQDRLLREAEDRLKQGLSGSMDVETIAVAVVEVAPK